MSFIRKIKKKNGQIYLAEVENKRINGKTVQKHIRYIGKEVDGETVISISSKDIEIDSVRVYGPILALHKIAEKIKLPEILGDYSNEILSMVYAHCIDYKSVRNMPKWYERTDLNLILNLEKLTESRLVSAMDSINDDKIDTLQKTIFSSVKKTYKLDTSGMVYDLTNTYFHGRHCPMGKKGRSKDGHRRDDLIQIALAATKKEGIPAFHKTFDGNIHDAKTLADISDSFSMHGLKSGLLVYDRGIVSEKNLKLLRKMGWHTLCGLPLREKEKNTIRCLLKKESINKISNMAVLGDSTFYVQGMPYQFGTVKGKLLICYNESKKLEITESRRRKIMAARESLDKSREANTDIESYLTPTGRIRTSLLKEKEIFDGFSCIFCTKNLPDKEMLRLYFDKDIIEKAFRTLKGVSNLRPVRCWLSHRVKAHVFLCYLSYLLLSLLKLNLISRKVDISPEQAIVELGSMYNVYICDSKKKYKLVRTVTLSKIQEKILKSVNPKILKNHIIRS